jgi:phosphoribosylformimino-5-aminoimidazole carboxamide ribotide isomerase
MIAIPAVDLRDGACVQLVGGAYEAERVRLDDPVAVAIAWADLGFAELHVVDLDAATGRGDNGAIVRDLVAGVQIPVQVGGGVRDAAGIQRLLDLGATRVVVGTRALEEPDWLAQAARDFPSRIVVAADVRGREVLTHGWARTVQEPLDRVLARLAELPLAGVLVTAVHREGRLAGPDLTITREAAAAVPHALYASGGIRSIADLRALRDVGAAGAVIGMALYTGALDAREAARTFGRARRPMTT